MSTLTLGERDFLRAIMTLFSLLGDLPKSGWKGHKPQDEVFLSASAGGRCFDSEVLSEPAL